MNFLVNASPLAGREGRFVTSRQLRERLERETKSNVALRVEYPADTDTFIVSGRGELHLTILLENMRRDGYELAVSRPRLVYQEIDGARCEPYEQLADGVAVAYALWKLQERGRMFVSPGDPVYEGMIVGIHSRDNDLVVNPIRTKQLTNIRASGKDEAILLTPPIDLTLEYAVEFIGDGELVEITPKSIRLRKRHLREHERRRAEREAA